MKHLVTEGSPYEALELKAPLQPLKDNMYRAELTLRVARENCGTSEGGTWDREGGFNGTIGRSDIVDQDSLNLERPIPKTLELLGLLCWLNVSYHWPSGSREVEIWVEGDDIDTFNLGALNITFQQLVARLSHRTAV